MELSFRGVTNSAELVQPSDWEEVQKSKGDEENKSKKECCGTGAQNQSHVSKPAGLQPL